MRDQRNLLATLMFSRGTPMLSMGSELGHTQQGNNNAYAQDMALDWLRDDAGLMAFASALIRLRLAHPALRDDRFLDGSHQEGGPDVQWLRADTAEMTAADWERHDNHTLLAVFCGDADRVLLVLHAGFAPCSIALPAPRPGHDWQLALDTSALEPLAQPIALGRASRLDIAERSVVLLVERTLPGSADFQSAD